MLLLLRMVLQLVELAIDLLHLELCVLRRFRSRLEAFVSHGQKVSA